MRDLATLWSAAFLAAGVLLVLVRLVAQVEDWRSRRSYRRRRRHIPSSPHVRQEAP